MRVVVLLLALAGCGEIADGAVDLLVDGEADYGRVYVCSMPCDLPTRPDLDFVGFEWCFDGGADELGRLKNDSCHPVGAWETRDGLFGWWPTVVGCAYDCEGRLHGGGANAHCGAFCP